MSHGEVQLERSKKSTGHELMALLAGHQHDNHHDELNFLAGLFFRKASTVSEIEEIASNRY